MMYPLFTLNLCLEINILLMHESAANDNVLFYLHNAVFVLGKIHTYTKNKGTRSFGTHFNSERSLTQYCLEE